MADVLERRGRAARVVTAAIGSGRWNVRSLSTTLCSAYVASGWMAGCVLFSAPNIVHIAAGALLVTEGHLTVAGGNRWDLRSRSFVAAANENLHAELLALFE